MKEADLIAALAKRAKISKSEAKRVVEAIFDANGIIADELKKGGKVQITGFGNFEARKRAARMSRNPRTGGVVQSKAAIAPAFRAASGLKAVIGVSGRTARSSESLGAREDASPSSGTHGSGPGDLD